jgi:multiple sugar transport system permease protein
MAPENFRAKSAALTQGQVDTRARPRYRLGLAGRRYLLAILLLLPAVGLRLFTAVYPFFQTIYLSLFKHNPAFPPSEFVGLGNFQRLSQDIAVRSSVSFTILFVVVSTILQLVLGLLVASLLNSEFRLRGLTRTVNLIPWAVPMVVAAIGFRWMYDVDYGIINDILRRLTGITFPWLINFWGARAAVIMTNVWKSTPFLAVVFLAALQGVPTELYEAARVDGASRLQSFRYVTIPLILPQATTMGLFMLVWQLASFDLIYTMTGGGPGFATQVLAYKIYQEAFGGLNFGYASAISMILFLVVGVVGGLGLLLYRRVQVLY